MNTSQNQNPSTSTERPLDWDTDIIHIDLESPQEYEISASLLSHTWKCFLKTATYDGSQSRRWNGRSQQELGDLGNVHVILLLNAAVHLWEELLGEFSFH